MRVGEIKAKQARLAISVVVQYALRLTVNWLRPIFYLGVVIFVPPMCLSAISEEGGQTANLYVVKHAQPTAGYSGAIHCRR